jgi:hypothetical protein
MLRLDLTASAPRWVEVAPGVRLHCLPVDTAAIMRARQALGDEGGDTPAALRVAQLVAAEVVVAWEGVGDAQGRPLALSPAALAALLNIAPVFDAFERLVLAPAMLLDAEKNVSSPSPSGSAAVAKPIAKAARPAARNARKT